MSRSAWASDDVMSHILAALTVPNRLAITVSLITGLRISDVLNLKTDQVRRCVFTITEQKTLKKRKVRIPQKLSDEILRYAGYIYAFESRSDPRRPRTRQAVYKDIIRARKAFRLTDKISPHSARKCYAVREYKKDFDIRRVKRLLNHSSEAVTMIYAMADELTERKKRG